MRKSARIVVILGIVLGLLLAVGTASTLAAKVTLNAIFMKQAGYSEDDVRAMISEFTKAHPDIQINPTFVAYEALHDKIVTAIASGGQGYDVIAIDDPWVAEFAAGGFARDITDKITPEMKKGIFPPALKSFAYKGRQYGLPWNSDTKFFFYNKQMLAKAGISAPPKTWDELYADARKIKEKGIVQYPIVWSWSQAEALICDYTVLVNGFGGDLFDDNNEPAFNRGGGLKALQFMVKTLKEGLSNPASIESLEEDVRRIYSTGQAAFALNWTYMYALANDPKESKVAGSTGVALMPDSISIYGALGLGIAKNTRHPNEAWEFVKFLTSPTIQKEYARLSLPIWSSQYDDPEVIKIQPELVKVAKEQFNKTTSRPRIPWYPEISQVLQVELQNALTGKKSPEKALDDAAAQIKELNKKYSR